MNRHRARNWLFVGSLLLSLFLLVLPLPDAVAAYKPYWPALVLVYWALEWPDKINLGLAFVTGLGADLLTGVLLGDQALRLTVLVFLVMRFRSRLRFFTMWQQILVVLALLLNNRVLQLAIGLFAGQPLPSPGFWVAPLIGALIWPLVFLLLDDLNTRLRVRET
ncbi:MAG TPA: rod shape-determining protein MreD [Oleiagrimonas sp.]|nr:rod shape-determining protein MreD [Oleiagrimonas sp.]